MMLKHIRALALALAAVAGLPGPLSATPDPTRLADLLTTPFLAQNITAVCGARDRRFLLETSGPHGTMHAYAQHIKEEVIASLRPSEFETVLRSAAEAARTLARGMLRELADASPSIEADRLDTWCQTFAKSLVRRVIAEHDAAHDRFLQSVEQAKGD